MQKTWRLVLVALLGILELTLFLALLVGYAEPVGQYGFTVSADGVTLSEVMPQSPAALAGLQPGDRIAYQTLSLLGRRILTLKEPVPANAPLTLQIEHEGQLVTKTLYAETIPHPYIAIETITYALAGFVFALIGLMLMILRPSRMTLAFALIAPPMLLPWSMLFWSQHSETIAGACYDIGVSLLYAMQMAGMMIFASRFPSGKPHRFTKLIDYLGLPIGLVIAAIYTSVTIVVRFTVIPLPHWDAISDYIIILPCLLAFAALIITYITTAGSARSRLAPVIGAFIVMIIAGGICQLAPMFTSNIDWLFAINVAYAASPLLVAIAVAYGVVRHRVMDIDFIVERTLIYTLLTAFVFAIFAIIEFVVGKLLERGRLAEIFEMIGAVGIGLSIDYMHDKIDRFLDLILFRRRYEARKRLSKVATTLPHAKAFTYIDEALVTEPMEALSLSSAAVFRRVGLGYTRVAAMGWSEQHAMTLGDDDNLVVRLRAESQAHNLQGLRWPHVSLPPGLLHPLYAIPIAVGHDLLAILLYGGHQSGEDLDPDERKSLLKLAYAAALAYGHLNQQAMHQHLEELKVENQTLQKIDVKLNEIVKSHLGKPFSP